jgi:hypothetical protein
VAGRGGFGGRAGAGGVDVGGGAEALRASRLAACAALRLSFRESFVVAIATS